MKKIISVFLPHDGCTHRCVFCHQPHITGIALHTDVTPDTIRKQIDTALHEPKSQQKDARFDIAFYGGTFTGLEIDVQEQFLHVAQEYVNRGDICGIRLSTHPNMFDEQIFALLTRFSITMVELGIQSFDDDVLRQARRGHTAEEGEIAINRLHRLGIPVGIHLMIGLPGDSYDTSLASARKTIALHPAAVRIHPTLVIQGTPLEQLYRQQRYIPLSLEEAINTCKTMIVDFQAHQIPVIRIGLQPTPSLEAHIVAGPYHPAIRQLVESEIAYEKMAALSIQSARNNNRLTIYVHPNDISTFRGQKNANIGRLQRQFSLADIRILPDHSLQRGTCRTR